VLVSQDEETLILNKLDFVQCFKSSAVKRTNFSAWGRGLC